MRKILFILLLFLPFAVQAQNYYVASWGSDATGNGSTETPYATLSHACSQVTTPGSVINIMTNITDNNRAYLRARVSVVGMGTRTITTSYVATSTSDAYLYLASTAGTVTNGSQSVSYIRFNGNNLTATRAIWVGYRANVEIHHCTIENFLYAGIHFRNQIDWTHPPTTYATGNSVHDCTFLNCSDMHTGEPAQLRLDGQSGMTIYNNIFNQTQRSISNNGANVRWSNVQKIKLYNNTFYKLSNEVTTSGDWNFFGELWHNHGDCEIYGNTFYGHATLDIAGFDNEIIAGNTFSYKIYDNEFINATKSDPVLVGVNDYSHQYAITIEGTDHEYLYIYNNHIQRYGYGIEIATAHSTTTGIPARNFLHDHFYIFNNIFEDMGYATYTYSAAIVLINEVNDPGYTNTSSNWWIVNNTMTGANRCYNGIRFTAIGTVSNINIKNNIIYDFSSYGIYITKRTTDVTTISSSAFTYNDLYSNGNTIYINGGISGAGTVDISTGNITTNPLFISSTDFHLQGSSPCIQTGTYIDTWLTTDYDGQGWLNPPSMGVYEIYGSGLPILSTSPVINITATTAVSGGAITSDGGQAVTARGVCWSTSTAPTTAGDKTTNGTGTGTFTSNVTGLSNGETYYLRAYATNSIGTAYGTERVFITPIPTSAGVHLLEHGGVLIIHNGKFIKSD